MKSISSPIPDIGSTKRYYGPSMKQSGALAVQPPRSGKTLGWFMDSEIFEKKRHSSSDDSNEKSGFIPTSSLAIGEERKKQKRLRKTMSCQGSARKEGYAASQATSESSEDAYDEKRVSSILADLTIQAEKQASNTVNEEYWFYDVASDGYYYEQNGAKGWRRRMPNSANSQLNKMKDQESATVNGKLSNRFMAAHIAAQAALIQQALLQQQHQQPTMRYYDPNSDGFYYEMASVDGWKRRQPNKPLAASVPSGITRPYAMRQAEQNIQANCFAAAAAAAAAASNSAPSYGAALARGQMPRNCVIDESSAASSTCGDLQELLGEQMYPSAISRPSSLKMEPRREQNAKHEQINPNFNADRFIRDLSFSGLGNGKIFGTPTPASPGNANNSWQPFRSCSLFHPSPMKSTSTVEDDTSMSMLMNDLEKLWAAPTPVNKA